MKKKVFIIIASMLAMLLCISCSMNQLEYQLNLGYDLNTLKNKEIVFHVYHSNTRDHKWELIASFPCQPVQGHYNDVKLEGEENKIRFVLKDTTYTESEDGNYETYDGSELQSYELDIDGFNGTLSGWSTFAIKEKEGEQPVRLYPISNNEAVSFFGDLENDFDITEPYDVEGVNLDNILITISIK